MNVQDRIKQLETNLVRLRAFSGNLGQRPYYSPTVFNYFMPDAKVPGTSILGPEFGIHTTVSAVGRANLVYTLVYGGYNARGRSEAEAKKIVSDAVALDHHPRHGVAGAAAVYRKHRRDCGAGQKTHQPKRDGDGRSQPGGCL